MDGQEDEVEVETFKERRREVRLVILYFFVRTTIQDETAVILCYVLHPL